MARYMLNMTASVTGSSYPVVVLRSGIYSIKCCINMKGLLMMKTLFTERAALRKLGIVLAGGVALMVVQSAASAAVTGGIVGSKHDLSSTATTGNNKFVASNGTSEICAFCHTPHGADTAAPAPLWNRKLGTQGAAYQSYASLGTTTLDGATLQVGSVSLACLSCHDGTQAMNTMINQPGSGGYDAAGATQAGTWTGNANAAGGKITNAGIAYIGTDLQNDHPVGIQYAGGGYLSGNATNSGAAAILADGTKKDPDFETPVAMKGNFWVDTTGGTSLKREKTDIILYTRSETNVAAQPYVECASCHDPHSTVNGTFLRMTNTGSKLCLACHTK